MTAATPAKKKSSPLGNKKIAPTLGIEKSPTGITGLDEILEGGLPKGRPTLVFGGAGCGKTLLSMEFLCRGATQFDEPGIFVSFEERRDDLVANVASIGFNVDELEAQGKLAIDNVRLDGVNTTESGAFNLEGLFIRIATLANAIGAKRIALDTLEVLFTSIQDPGIVRTELRRLFEWLKDRGLTAMVTAESSSHQGGTRYGIEEFVSDCVIFLDHRTSDERAVRRLRVLKYRGSLHHADEFPFIITSKGINILPVFAMRLDQQAFSEKISTGVAHLDHTLTGGYYRGSSVLISGSAGTAKTTFAFHFVRAACERGERTLYISYEESPSQIVRNLRSVGLDVQVWLDEGLLRIESLRPTLYSIEGHLLWLMQIVDEFEPRNVVIDPVTSFLRMGSSQQTASMSFREIDILKSRGITSVFTALSSSGEDEHSEVLISSLVDTWLLTRLVETNGERNRVLFIIKSRGMAHSNQVAEFGITDHGIELFDPYIGPSGVLTGTARILQVEKERAVAEERVELMKRLQERMERKRLDVESQVGALWRAFEEERAMLDDSVLDVVGALEEVLHLRNLMRTSRWSTNDELSDDNG
jgi:circadian clock protein KaiC